MQALTILAERVAAIIRKYLKRKHKAEEIEKLEKEILEADTPEERQRAADTIKNRFNNHND